MKIIIYTALVGNIRSHIAPPEVMEFPDTDFVCFTDQSAHKIPKPWRVVPIDKISYKSDDLSRVSKFFKIQPHKIGLFNYDINIWVDSNIVVTEGFGRIIEQYMLKDIYKYIGWSHFERNCLYNEAKIVSDWGLEHPDIVSNQMARYRNEGFPENYGLAENGVSIRCNTFEVRRLLDLWWFEYLRGARRDQLSFMYAVWKQKMQDKVKIFDCSLRDAPEFKWVQHQPTGKI